MAGNPKTGHPLQEEGRGTDRGGSRAQRNSFQPAREPVNYSQDVSETIRAGEGADKINVDMYKGFIRNWNVEWNKVVVVVNLSGPILEVVAHPISNVALHLEPNKLVAHQLLRSMHTGVGESVEEVEHLAVQCRGAWTTSLWWLEEESQRMVGPPGLRTTSDKCILVMGVQEADTLADVL